MAENIIQGLAELGIDGVAVGMPRMHGKNLYVNHLNTLASDNAIRWDGRQQQKLVERIRETEADVVITVDPGLLPQTVSAIKETGASIGLWYPDVVANLGRNMCLVADYDVLYFKDPDYVDRLSAQTLAPVQYLPEACNPTWHRPDGGPSMTDSHVIIAGNMYPSRVLVVDRLVSDGIPLRMYGSGFPRWVPRRTWMANHTGTSVHRDEKARAFRQSRAVLNNLHPTENGANARLFEAAGCGAATLCEFREPTSALFNDDEVAFYRTYDELLSSARRLLEDPDYGRSLGDNAARRAHAEHTYAHRMRAILEDLA